MSKHFYITVLLVAFSMLSFFSSAQNNMREVGMHVSNLSLTNLSPSFIYKKQIGDNLYKRYNFSFANLDFQHNKNLSRYGFSTSLGIGKEKRRDIGKRLKFIRGLQYTGGLSFNHDSNSSNSSFIKQTTYSANIGLGYLLGVQFDISPAFYINLETVPYANFSYQFSNRKQTNADTVSDNTFRLNSNYSNAIGINLVYRFEKNQ